MVKMLRDYVERRVVVEYGLKYVYVYITNADGKLIDDDAFTQPYRLERKECHEEAKEAFDMVWEYLNETINFPTSGDGGQSDRPNEEEE